jgi:hypothetical protein
VAVLFDGLHNQGLVLETSCITDQIAQPYLGEWAIALHGMVLVPSGYWF